MKKLVQWWNDRRDRKLRERLSDKWNGSFHELVLMFDYVKTGECPDHLLYKTLLAIKRINPEKYQEIIKEVNKESPFVSTL